MLAQEKMGIRAALVGAALGGTALVSPQLALARDYNVRTESELSTALRAAKPGDRVFLREGEWKDLQFSIKQGGTAAKPVIVAAKVAGKTIITGESSVRIAGDNIVLANLVFRDGYSPSSTVINVRGSGDHLPKNNRITGNVVENFSKPDKTQKDYWVSLTGEGHRVDHNAFVGKTNAGPTMVVRLDLDKGKPNNHKIEYNYFGPRPDFGGNGAETIRVGTSTVVDDVSGTQIYRNVFERTNGEPEVISLKSRENVVAENTFYEVSGALTFRQGGKNVARRNVFVGNGREKTGGIRLTGSDHTVTENYFEGLNGTGYLSALTLMNGESDASSSGYRAVQRATITNNSFYDSLQFAFGAGANDSRTVTPTQVAMSGNLFGGQTAMKLREYAPLGGVAFTGNVASPKIRLGNGIAATETFEVRREKNGLLYAYRDGQRIETGVPFDMQPVTWREVGPAYYEKPTPNTTQSAG
ncbi:polysaccharide lyase 6 family protein [Croceicoccus naphthovorans]|uniref:polysaccharide lyase 6 family protein n=1 Tax=Croceicoccus naphthovorans TaxID=1348774 RepID=UPI00069E3521|nr:polysaccharide lyase 6 family protein [Croceicoccus naphthovorans]MBB3991946.1 poly(beta-D-mannuronate) lyase [Croceicoccus naphthovorans]